MKKVQTHTLQPKEIFIKYELTKTAALIITNCTCSKAKKVC